MQTGRISFALGLIAASLIAPAALAQSGPPPVEQDCQRGETAHEVYASENVGGGTFANRLHFCIRNTVHGIQVFQQARTEVSQDPLISPAMRADLLRQIDAKIAWFNSELR